MSFNYQLLKTIALSLLGGLIIFLLYLLVIVFIGIPNTNSDFLNTVFIGPIKEEILKFLVVLFFIKRFTSYKLTATSVGFGFGLGEQLLHLYHGDPILWYVILMHSIAGFVSGVFLQKNSKFRAIFGATTVHVIYNLGLWIYILFIISY